MSFSEYIGSQFGNPHGFVGKICCLAMNTINKKLYANVATTVINSGAKNVLDIGFGNGHLEKKLLKHENVTVSGIDISEDMLKAATKKNKKAVTNGSLILSLGDCCDLKFEDNTFDAVASVNTIYFWNDTIKGLSEICRVLKDKGVFANAVYSQEWLKRVSYTKKGFKFFSTEDYIADGLKAGFSDVEVTEIIKGKSYLITYIK
jgi:ubiquinone/menaquinone biosynthesis C-methylase UbiE